MKEDDKISQEQDKPVDDGLNPPKEEQQPVHKVDGYKPEADTTTKQQPAEGSSSGSVSEGHTSDGANGTATTTNEPTLRSATTDSSRRGKATNDDGRTGGNIR